MYLFIDLGVAPLSRWCFSGFIYS